jgi:bifunctional DNA-binding transcriptional regulator/antitoxin component of YhaV-PrlF toxin-antitoxin module
VPLTEAVSFKTCLQKGNRVQVPKPVRWQFKLEASQVLRVMVCLVDVRMSWETFYGRMDESGRITIPKLTLSLLQSKADQQSLIGAVMEVNLEPA